MSESSITSVHSPKTGAKLSRFKKSIQHMIIVSSLIQGVHPIRKSVRDCYIGLVSGNPSYEDRGSEIVRSETDSRLLLFALSGSSKYDESNWHRGVKIYCASPLPHQPINATIEAISGATGIRNM